MSDPFVPYHRLLAMLMGFNLLVVGVLIALWVVWSDRAERRFDLPFRLSLVLTGAFLWPMIPYWRGQCGKAAVALAYAVAGAFLASMIFLYKGLALSAVAALYEARAVALIEAGKKAEAEAFVAGMEALAAEHARHAGAYLPTQAGRLSESARLLREKAR